MAEATRCRVFLTENPQRSLILVGRTDAMDSLARTKIRVLVAFRDTTRNGFPHSFLVDAMIFLTHSYSRGCCCRRHAVAAKVSCSLVTRCFWRSSALEKLGQVGFLTHDGRSHKNGWGGNVHVSWLSGGYGNVLNVRVLRGSWKVCGAIGRMVAGRCFLFVSCIRLPTLRRECRR